MVWVLIWLASGAFAATASALRFGMWFTATALRATSPLIVAAVLLMLTDWFEGYQVIYDPNDPLVVVPYIIKWAWLAGIAAVLPGRAKYLCVALLVWLHIDAVGFLAAEAEALLYVDHAGRAAWLADKVTVLEAQVRPLWSGLWGDTTGYPSAIVIGLLLPLMTWLVPLCLLLLAAWCWALHRSAAANTWGVEQPNDDPIRPLRAELLAATAVLALVGALLDGPAALIAADFARMLWLIHLAGTLRLLWRHTRLRVPLASLAPAALILPEAAGIIIGVIGIAWTFWGVAQSHSRTRLAPLTAVPAILAALVSYGILRTADIAPAPADQDDRGAAAVQYRTLGTADSAEAAQAVCRREHADLCMASEWVAAAVDQGARRRGFNNTGGEWVQLTAGEDTVPGIAVIRTSHGIDVPLLIAEPARAALGDITIAVRCCRDDGRR